LLVQKEVAERVAQPPGKMSFISAAVQLNYEVSLGDIVRAELFIPAPKVDSRVLILEQLKQPRFTDVDYLKLIRFIKAGFNQPRKTLVNNLSSSLGLDRSIVESRLLEHNLKPTVRAQELSLTNWHNLYKKLT
jgi:16S rRNA (adenine1518-N6/adenine1519-N6)-dimethyltransferase